MSTTIVSIGLKSIKSVKAIKDVEVTREISDAVLNAEIYWSDDRNEHYFYDFKIGNKWISSRVISNDLRNFLIEIYEG